VAGLGGVQPYLAEAGVGQLGGEVLGLVAGQAVDGVPARSRPGQALGEAVAAFLAAAAAAAAGEISR